MGNPSRRTVFGTSCEAEERPADLSSAKRARSAKKAAQKDPFARIVALCSVRDRSARELEERLAKEGYAAEDATAAIKRALDCNLVDDARFADAFIRGRVRAGKGLAVVLRDLEKHGIDPKTLDGWPDEYGLGQQDQLVRAVELLSMHPPRAKDKQGSAFRKLVGKGYPKGVAAKAARVWAESQQAHE